jgi:hypothetical protein
MIAGQATAVISQAGLFFAFCLFCRLNRIQVLTE